MSAENITGGCQCGAVRFRAAGLGRASICHCRMCQKAFGGLFGPLVTAKGLEWTRGEPKRFASSNVARRGFCAACGTPLTYEYEGGIDVAIGALDDPNLAPPTVQLNPADKLAVYDELHRLPGRPPDEQAASDAFLASVENHQHPDHDTESWPSKERQ
ncbi:GFA family protein [Allomesorhizobium camelthorni]|uniref:GFA family protein n=1 Tax=Allomesorhizobium camelthorni TaxID=475069 RepID=A0A6G4WID4_9HYPH|nr:GFA family protein [Mesorhizobium camelthorni]NGO53986.1 GFA family protein [Mesorhizobium camelthorni]